MYTQSLGVSCDGVLNRGGGGNFWPSIHVDTCMFLIYLRKCVNDLRLTTRVNVRSGWVNITNHPVRSGWVNITYHPVRSSWANKEAGRHILYVVLVVSDAWHPSIHCPQKPRPLKNRPANVIPVISVYKNFLCKNL